jgi:hypothetical protein
MNPIERTLQHKTCGNCNHGDYAEGGDNGTVGCGMGCTLRNKFDTCPSWTWPRWLPETVVPTEGSPCS